MHTPQIPPLSNPFCPRGAVCRSIGMVKEKQAAYRETCMAKQRVAEAEKLGFEECVVPLVSLEECKKGSKIRVIGVSSVQDAVDKVFG